MERCVCTQDDYFGLREHHGMRASLQYYNQFILHKTSVGSDTVGCFTEMDKMSTL